MLNNENIKIAMLEISSQEKAILEFYFDSVGKDLYSVVYENEADTVIIDYDLPDAKENVADLLETNHASIMVLADEDPKLESTLWVAKPLTADALTESASLIKQTLTSVDVDISNNDEADIEISDNDLSVSSSSLTSATDDTNHEQEVFESEEKDNFEFNEILNTDIKSESDQESIIETVAETDSEIDELLNSLLDEENTVEVLDEREAIESDAKDIFCESLSLDDEINNDSESLAQTLEPRQPKKTYLKNSSDAFEALDSDVVLDQSEIVETPLDDINIENVDLDDVDLNETELLKESIPLKEDENLIKTDKKSILLDENKIRHVDPDVATKTVFAETLIVDYQDVESKTNIDEIEKTSIEEVQLSIDVIDESAANAKSNTTNEIDSAKKDIETETDIDSLLNEVSAEAELLIPAQENKNATEEAIVADSSTITEDLTVSENSAEKSIAPTDSDLQSLLNEVRQEASNYEEEQDGLEGTKVLNKTNDEKRWLQLCGNLENIKRQKDLAKMSFTVEKHLLNEALKLITSVNDTEQLFRLKYRDLVIVLDKSKDTIYCNVPLTDDDYAEVCFNEIDVKEIKIYDLDYSEIRLYQSKSSKYPERVHSIESFIWLTSLLTSRGRLPEKTELNKKIGLRIWPNLTRLELPPHAMHIAATLSKHSASLIELSQWLKIDQRYVFSFYYAALSLDMIELDCSKLKESAQELTNNNSAIKAKEKGFFGGLFKKKKA